MGEYNPDEIIGYWELGTNRVLCPNCADTDADVPFTKDEINVDKPLVCDGYHSSVGKCDTPRIN